MIENLQHMVKRIINFGLLFIIIESQAWGLEKYCTEDNIQITEDWWRCYGLWRKDEMFITTNALGEDN